MRISAKLRLGGPCCRLAAVMVMALFMIMDSMDGGYDGCDGCDGSNRKQINY